MKRIYLTLATLAVAFSVHAQNTNGVAMPSSGILQSLDLHATNWVVIPFAGYQMQAHKWGGGACALYTATPNLWTGLRYQTFSGTEQTASVQGQLQATETILGVQVTPFLESAVGVGRDALYGNAGVGGLINLHTWNISQTAKLGLGLIGDYEHFVMGSSSGNQVNFGAALHLRF